MKKTEYLELIFRNADIMHRKLNGKPLSDADKEAFDDADIRSLDDLYDDESIFTSTDAVVAFDDALTTHEAIKARIAMEDSFDEY